MRNFVLGDAFANLFHNFLIACETKFTVVLLHFLASRVQLGHVRWKNRQIGSRLRPACRGLRSLHHQTVVRNECADKCFA